jgi:hypothetical protein
MKTLTILVQPQIARINSRTGLKEYPAIHVQRDGARLHFSMGFYSSSETLHLRAEHLERKNFKTTEEIYSGATRNFAAAWAWAAEAEAELQQRAHMASVEDYKEMGRTQQHAFRPRAKQA